MVVLGIDPGSLKIGYALIELNLDSFKYLFSGIFTYQKYKFIERPKHIYLDIFNLVNKFHPDEVALEGLIYVKSVPALSKLAQARGAILAALNTDKIFEYAPNLIKSTVTAYGLSSKEDVQRTLNLIYGNINFKSLDEADALAIATTHAVCRKVRQVEQMPSA